MGIVVEPEKKNKLRNIDKKKRKERPKRRAWYLPMLPTPKIKKSA
jgi:hypothetical protein